MKGYCPACDELRTDSYDDAWGFAFVASIPQCLRCGSIVELEANGQSNETVELEDGDDSAIGG